MSTKLLPSALGKIGKSAVDRLILVLKDSNASAREGAAQALEAIHDARATEPFMAALHDSSSDVRRYAALALTPVRDARITSAFLRGLRENDLPIVAGAHTFFIQRGDRAAEDALMRSLDKNGFVSMAEALLNCGNEKLAQAARDWARSHGYNVVYGGKRGPRWGRTP